MQYIFIKMISFLRGSIVRAFYGETKHPGQCMYYQRRLAAILQDFQFDLLRDLCIPADNDRGSAANIQDYPESPISEGRRLCLDLG